MVVEINVTEEWEQVKRYSCPCAGLRPKLSAMGLQKRTATVKFELTMHQNNQLRALGRALWPDLNLDRNEVCRRVLLDGADRRMVRSDGERLLEAFCQPEA